MGAAEGSGTTGADAGAASKKGKGRARNKVAELSWFINNVDQRDRDREGRYQWANVGGECLVLYLHVTPYQATERLVTINGHQSKVMSQ